MPKAFGKLAVEPPLVTMIELEMGWREGAWSVWGAVMKGPSWIYLDVSRSSD